MGAVQERLQRLHELENEVATLREEQAKAQAQEELLRSENERLSEQLRRMQEQQLAAAPAKGELDPAASTDAQEALQELRALTERVKKAAELAATIAAPNAQ